MPADAPSTDPVDQRPAPQSRSQQALSAYTARMRRARAGYALLLTVIVVVVVVAVSLAWSHGEVANTTLRTATSPAPSIAPATPAGTVTQAWASNDQTAIGTPVWGGTVITYSAHTVAGRNAATGAVSWSYSRSNRTVCQAIQTGGVTIAIYRIKGDCQEVTALDSGTGHRVWTRTLFENGYPVDGSPSYQVTPTSIMITTPSVIYLVNTPADGPDPGDDVWMFAQAGCTIHSAVLGSAGALISQTCAHPDCTGLTYCHPGPQLLLRDPSAAFDDSDAHKANPNQILWNLPGNTDVPVSADQLVSAFDPNTHALHVFDSKKGTRTASLALDPSLSSIPPVAAIATVDRELIWADGLSYAIGNQAPAVLWSALTSAPPTVTSTDAQDAGGPFDLTNALIAAPVTGGVGLLDADTGRTNRVVAVAAIPVGDLAYPLGSGFLVAGTTTTVYR